MVPGIGMVLEWYSKCWNWYFTEIALRKPAGTLGEDTGQWKSLYGNQPYTGRLDSGRTWAGHWDSGNPTMETSSLVVDWDSGYTWEGHWGSGNSTMETSPLVVDGDSGYTWEGHWGSWKSHYGNPPFSGRLGLGTLGQNWDSGNPTTETSPLVLDWDSRCTWEGNQSYSGRLG